jgi:glutathione S-transferase
MIRGQVIYYAPTSPYARKVRAVAHRLGVALELERVNPVGWDNDYGKVNPINRVPSLLLDDGVVLFDSPVICEFLDATYGPVLIPPGGRDRWDTLCRQALGDGIMDAAVPRRYELLRPQNLQSSDRLALYARSVEQALDHLETRARTLPHDDLGAIAIASALDYLELRFPDEPWANGRPLLHEWYKPQAQREFMKATLPERI